MLSDFLSENGISVEQVIARSKALESHTSADHELSVKRGAARRDKKKYDELSLGKPPALGRGVGPSTIKKAIAGDKMPRLVRKKLTRAINSVLASQKKEPVDFRRLFGDVGSRKGKSTKK